MVEEHPATTEGDSAAVFRSARTGRRWFVPLIVALLAVIVCAGFVLVRTFLWPTGLEQEIRLDLITKDKIDEDTRVTVLNELKLFSFYTKFGPQRFATLCLQESDGRLHLAYARCWREGMMWHTYSDRWRRLTAWPSLEEIRTFEDEHADVVAAALKSGCLPRPPGTEGFQLTHLSIQVSEDIEGFEPNRNVDPIVFADALKHGIVLGSFAFADFHEPRWHSAKDGVEAVEKSIGHLQLLLDEPECRAIDCESLLDVLHAVKDRLLRAEELNLKFYFLGTDRSAE